MRLTSIRKPNVDCTQKGKAFSLHIDPARQGEMIRQQIYALYPNPLAAAIREVISNAYDANREAANLTKGIVVRLDKELLSVRDFGLGLGTEERLEDYTKVGYSTKRDVTNSDCDDFIGAFGLGRLAALALSEHYFITSFAGGLKTQYIVYMNDSDLPEISVYDDIENIPTDEEDGCLVEVLIPGEYVGEKWGTVRNRLISLLELSRHAYDLAIDNGEEVEVRAQPAPVLNVKLNNGIEADYYALDRLNVGEVLNGRFSPKGDSIGLELVLDMGGALYPISWNDNNADAVADDYSISFRGNDVQKYGPVHKTFDILGEEWLGMAEVLEPTMPRPGTWVSSFDTTTRGILVLRVQPDFVQLTSGREDFVESEVARVRMGRTIWEAHEALKVEAQSVADAAVASRLETMDTVRLAKLIAITATLKWSRTTRIKARHLRLKRAFYGTEVLRVTLPNGYTMECYSDEEVSAFRVDHDLKTFRFCAGTSDDPTILCRTFEKNNMSKEKFGIISHVFAELSSYSKIVQEGLETEFTRIGNTNQYVFSTKYYLELGSGLRCTCPLIGTVESEKVKPDYEELLSKHGDIIKDNPVNCLTFRSPEVLELVDKDLSAIAPLINYLGTLRKEVAPKKKKSRKRVV